VPQERDLSLSNGDEDKRGGLAHKSALTVRRKVTKTLPKNFLKLSTKIFFITNQQQNKTLFTQKIGSRKIQRFKAL